MRIPSSPSPATPTIPGETATSSPPGGSGFDAVKGRTTITDVGTLPSGPASHGALQVRLGATADADDDGACDVAGHQPGGAGGL